jgi:magnesium-protoporphyrin IX monomethyl ester (oxidative) cyclase
MRVLLINSPYYFPDQIAHRAELLGLEYLGSSLRKTGHEVFIYDPTMCKPTQLLNGLYYYGTTYENMYNRIKSFQPDYVGISCHYSYAEKEAYKVAKIVKNINSNIVVVMGGLFISVFNEKALIECDAIDYCLIGESEMSFPDLLLSISLKN